MMFIYYYIKLVLVVRKGKQLGKNKRYLEVNKLYKNFYNHIKNKFDESNFLIRQSMFNVGASYYRLSLYEEALEYFVKVYELDKKVLNEENDDILRDLSHIGKTYAEIGNYEKQLEYNKMCYEIRKKKLGEDHPDTLISLGNLALSYEGVGDYKKGLEYNKKCYEFRKKVLGEDHPYTLTNLSNLAVSYGNIGDYEKQLEYNKMCYEIKKNILGEDHPNTLTSLNNLAVSYGNIGDYEKQLEYNKMCYEIRKKKLGEDHPDTLISLGNLALSYESMGDYKKGLEYNKMCYEIRKKKLGEDHPDTLINLSNLAVSYGNIGDYKKQLEYNKMCYEIRKKKLGEDHPDTLISLNNFAVNFGHIGDYEKQLEYSKKSYVLSEKGLDKKYPYTLSILNTLYYSYFKTKDYNSYERYYKKYTEIQNKNILNLLPIIQKGNYKNYLKSFVNSALIYTNYYFMYKNDKNDYHYIVSYKNILQDIEIMEYKLRKIPEYIQKTNYINELDKRISEEINADTVVNLQFQREKTNNELKQITEQYQNQLLLDIDYQMIVNRLEDNDLLLDYYQLNNQYGLVIIGKDIFESVVIDDYGLEYIIIYLDNIDHIYICPDGELYNVSFERLIDKKISYLSSPKGLFMDNDTSNNEDIVSFVSPDFSDTLDDDGDDTRGGKKNQLLGSLVEGLYIDDIFQDVTTYSGKKASATHFMKVESPSVLHVSTHGDYLEDKTNIMEKGILCLAGYNLDNKKEEYGKGYVSANDIQYMNLKNTDLVVLSACNTAKGEVLPGEGVYGLRRAFELAGAKTLLITVEEINDHNAAIFMKNFYQRYHESRNAYQSFLETKTYLQNNQNALKELEEYVNEFPEDMKRKYTNTYQYQIKGYLELCKEKGYLLRGEDQKEDFNGFIIQGRISR